MKDDTRTPDVPEDGMHVSAPAQTDWPIEQVEKIAQMLYTRGPFRVEEKENWEFLVRQAFIFLDNLREACKEILKERKEDRETDAEENARKIDEYKKLLAVAPFEEAVRFITGKTRPGRALPEFDKVLRYDARVELLPSISIGPDGWETTVLPKLPAEKKRRVEAQLKIWQQNGIPRSEVLRLQSLFGHTWPRVVAEQNSAKRKRRGGTRPKAERRLQPALIEVAEWGKKKRSAKKVI
jgi:hypothetical protein